MGSAGDAYDNAIAESYFAILECELLDRRRFRTPTGARMAAFELIEGWYNPQRRHSVLGYLSPIVKGYQMPASRMRRQSSMTPPADV